MLKTYVISPYAGNIRRNIKNAVAYAKYTVSCGYLPLAAHLYFTQFTNDAIPAERKQGLEMGIEMLKTCDEAWVFYSNRISKGMAGEIQKAKELNIPLRCFQCRNEDVLYEFPIEELNFRYKTIKYDNFSEAGKRKTNKPRYEEISDYVAFDLETTGLNPEKDEIINIGAIRYRNNMPVEELNILVNPQKDIPEIITNITGITNDMVKDKPTIKEVLPTLLEFIGKDIVLGHNVRFDLGFLNYALEVHGFEHYVTKYVDTLTIARSFRKNNKLENLVKDYLKPDFTQAHLALSDAKYTAEIFKVFKNMYLKPNSCYNLDKKCE